MGLTQRMNQTCIAVFMAVVSISAAQRLPPSAAQEPPREWTDPTTHHHIIRLSDEPGSASLYFHQNAYTARGDLMVFTTHNGLSVIDLNTRKIRPIVEGRVSDVVVGRKTPQVFYFKGDTVYATNLDSGETRPIVTKPELRSGSGLAVNADETLLGGSFVEGPPPQPATPTTPPGTSPQERGDNYPGKGAMMERRLAARIPMALYTINIK